MRSLKRIKRMITTLLLAALIANLMLPMAAAAAEQQDNKVVRVGWFDSSFCYYDQFGRRCGVDYEYHQKISAYTGWTYEYVEDSWPNLLQKLKDGEIDLLSDVSYKPEREQYMYFSDLAMGTEAYYIYVDADNREITADDLSSFNGKKIGVNKDSIQETFLKEWTEKNEVSPKIVPLTCSEDESMELLIKGEIDGLATVYTFDFSKEVIPVSRIGGSDYFYAVNKKRPDLIKELNVAMAAIQDEDPYFNEKITKERIFNSKSKTVLSGQQDDWLKEHGEIRIGYRNGYLPFCDTDDSEELTGALKDYVAHLLSNMNSSNLKFKTIPYDKTEDALKALEDGEVDCVFPIYMSTYDAAERGIMLTDPVMKTEMNAIMRTSDRQDLSEDSKLTFAVNANMLNIESFIMQYYPNAERKPYDGLQACYDAVAKGEADCVLVSNYRIPSEEDTLKKNDLFTVPTGESLSFSFAVKKADRELYAILNKSVLSINTTEMDATLASYIYSDQKVSFMQFLKNNWLIVVAVLIVFFTFIVFLLVSKMRAERLASRQKHMLEEAEQIADLQQTVSSLLDNMPGLYLTKDAETGKYLACNQAFADFANKKDPSEIVGLTPADIFDAEKAKHIEEDDQMALSMDEPLIIHDELQDALGNRTKFRITRQKYTDANGRLCVLGIFQDASESFRVSRDKALTKEAYEKARKDGIIFTHIAQALAQGFQYLFYVDLNTEEFIEYHSDDKDASLTEARRGWHFFEEGQDAAEQNVYPEDREEVIRAMERRTLVAELDKNNSFMMTYRMLTPGDPVYVSMKVTRMQDDDRFIIMSITDIDEQMKHRQAAQRMLEEQTAYGRISALSGDYLCIYIVSPQTGHYREYSSAAGFEAFSMPAEGDNFFSDLRERSISTVYQEDQNRVFTALTMENALEEVGKNGIFTLSYRLMMNGEPRYVQLKAARVDEQGGESLVVGINDIDVQVRQEEEYSRRLAQARIEANIDALTGVKNRNAYRVYEERLNAQIEMNRAPDFAITILDVNDLKKVNDTQGHKAGDQFIRDACRIICTTFKRSPVFRVGGDEFAVLSQGDDYQHIDELTALIDAHNEDAAANGGIVIALGMSRYEQDTKVSQVYERADQKMYENKSELKKNRN